MNESNKASAPANSGKACKVCNTCGSAQSIEATACDKCGAGAARAALTAKTLTRAQFNTLSAKDKAAHCKNGGILTDK